ncbi:MAG: chemotaxis protein CheD [Candidatus Lokiarchaeia archaeon]
MKKIGPHGYIEKSDKNGEIFLPIGHYTIINCRNKVNNIRPKITIYGLGSCIALILFDYKSNVSGMSHILLPKSRQNKTINFPHKYADLSAKLLVQELMNHGAIRKNIRAIIIGGSKIFDLDENFMGIDNTQAIKQELEKLEIKLVGEETGGTIGRAVIFDTKDFSVYFKSTKEKVYNKIK